MPDKGWSEQEWRTLVANEVVRSFQLFYKIAYGVLEDADAAEDACQQALVKVLPRRRELRCDDWLRSWMAKVVLNESLAMRRRRRAEKLMLEDQTIPHRSTPNTADQELREAVKDAVESLPEHLRLTVSLRQLDGLSGAVVAEILGCSEAHVCRQFHVAMASLRVALREFKSERQSSKKVG